MTGSHGGIGWEKPGKTICMQVCHWQDAWQVCMMDIVLSFQVIDYQPSCRVWSSLPEQQEEESRCERTNVLSEFLFVAVVVAVPLEVHDRGVPSIIKRI
jgi:hypothetical protein